MDDKENNIENFTREYLRRIDQKLDLVSSDISVLKETTGRIDIRLKIVEAHMTGFMSSAKYLETEIDALRGRIEALEQHIHRSKGPS